MEHVARNNNNNNNNNNVMSDGKKKEEGIVVSEMGVGDGEVQVAFHYAERRGNKGRQLKHQFGLCQTKLALLLIASVLMKEKAHRNQQITKVRFVVRVVGWACDVPEMESRLKNVW
ncbi:hypothetical protein PIB30_006489 [Stylosanthes scabra]|uniref:Uncharacterized protein n=1 Tax=Stylosanthes scabra TaxID=79078 RepID=A0ABU6V5R3_9FABA|nr:hypothetical protein [Stylosanthes scabra]